MVKVRNGVVPPRGARKSGSRARKATAPAEAPRVERARKMPAVVEVPPPAPLPPRIAPIEAVRPPSASPVYRPIAKPASLTPSAGPQSGDRSPPPGPVMELHWDDEPPRRVRGDALVERWVKRGDALLRHLAEHGASRHEYRADLKEGRFLWLSPEGRVSAEAEARVLCSYAPLTATLRMGWTDPLVRDASVGRLQDMAPEHDEVDEEAAWRVAMEAADRAGAEYLHRVTTPHIWYFLSLRKLTFAPARASFTPGTPVGLVVRSLLETRVAIESRAEPSEVVRGRLTGVGHALLQEAGYAYRGTDWVSRLERTGKWLLLLAERLPRASFRSLAAGRRADEWLDREAAVDLSQAIVLLEDEWSLFA